MQVHHACHAVETEPVDAEFVEPVAAVRQQEMQHLRLRIVEEQRVPRRVLAARSRVKERGAAAVVAAEPFNLVAGRMRVHEVDDDAQPEAMRRIDQLLELVRCAEPPRHCEEIGDVIAETAVVRMPHDRHQLNRIVAGLCDARQGFHPELRKAADLRLFLRHADMRLVDERHGGSGRRRMPERIGPFRRVDHRREETGRFILHDAAGIGGHPVATAALPLHREQVVVAVAERFGREPEFPGAARL